MGAARQCLMPVSTGERCADAPERRWHYDVTRADCLAFSYQGCGGTENNFRFYEDCAYLCRVTLPGTSGSLQRSSMKGLLKPRLYSLNVILSFLLHFLLMPVPIPQVDLVASTGKDKKRDVAGLSIDQLCLVDVMIRIQYELIVIMLSMVKSESSKPVGVILLLAYVARSVLRHFSWIRFLFCLCTT